MEEQVSSPYENVNCSEKLKQNFAEHTVTNKEHTNQTEHGDFVNNILFDVYSDFERTLERAESGNRKKSKQTSKTFHIFKLELLTHLIHMCMIQRKQLYFSIKMINF